MSAIASVTAFKAVALSDLIAETKPGFAIGTRTPNGVIQVRMNNVDTLGKLDLVDTIRVPATQKQVADCSLEAGDVLFNNTNSTELVGKTAIFLGHDEPVTFSNHFTRMRVQANRLEPRYLARWLTKLQRSRVFEGLCTRWVGQSAVKSEKVLALKIPLPIPDDRERSLAEQRRLADVLDKAEAVRRKREEMSQELHDLRRSLLFAFTGDAVNVHVRRELHNTSRYLPDGFTWRKLEDVCVAICDIDHNMPKAVDAGIPFISPKDMPDDGDLCFDKVKYISREDFDRLSRKIKPQRNDIIYSRIGARLGKAKLVKVDFDFLASYSCCTIRVNEKVIHPIYLTQYLDSVITRCQANLDTQSIAVPDLGLAKIKSFLVPVPSLPKQTTFVAQLDAVNEQMKKVESGVTDADNLFNSLIQRAFQGEL